MIDEAIGPLIGDASVQVVNLMAPIGPDEATDPNEVKVAVDRRSNALYFSRLPLPWQNGSGHAPIFKQVCVIPFRRAFLAQFAALEPTGARAGRIDRHAARARARLCRTHGTDRTRDVQRRHARRSRACRPLDAE